MLSIFLTEQRLVSDEERSYGWHSLCGMLNHQRY